MTIPRMQSRKAQQYLRSGLLLIDPQACGSFFFGGGAREPLTVGGATVLDVEGPLEHHSDFFFDSYEDILERVRVACASNTLAIVLRFDSPGGQASGCFESARELRAICDEAGKQLHAYVEGSCNSAAYALACVCDSITLGESGLAGSIGVLMSRFDQSAMNTAHGLRVALITSGARKADGHPDAPITAEELASSQGIVDSLAQTFFEHVAAHRAVLSVEQLAQLQAQVMHGPAAVTAGLADEVGPLSAVIERISNGGGMTTMAGTPYQKARAALEEAAKGDDANAKAARAGLAAMKAIGADDDGGGDEEKKKEDPPAGDPPAKTEGDPAGDPPKKEDEAAASSATSAEATAASAMRLAAAADAKAARLEAEIARRDEVDERRTLLASRVLAPEMRTLLEKAPMSLVRETIKALPEKPTDPVNVELGGAPLRGDSTGSESHLPPEQKRRMDERMGLVQPDARAESTPYRLVLGPKPKTATSPPSSSN